MLYKCYHQKDYSKVLIERFSLCVETEEWTWPWTAPRHTRRGCRVDGIVYDVGEPMPSEYLCQTGW